MDKRLANKVALVTGGASGIGRAAALELAREGARVMISDLDDEGGKSTVAAIEGLGGEAAYARGDVTKADDVEALVGRTAETFGRLDVAFNNAGITGELKSLVDTDEENWDRVIGVNLKGVWLCLKYQIGYMRDHGGGAIVNTASVLGLVGGSRSPVAYVASKHGVVGLTKAAALAHAPDGIRVNAVCPGYIDTPLLEPVFERFPERKAQTVALHPAGRLGQAEEVAKAVVWLCSDAASFVTGEAMTVDGGYTAQ